MTQETLIRESDITGSDALLVVDMQNDFCSGGTLEVPGADALIPAINKLQQYFRHVVLTQDWHPAGHKSFASAHAGKKPLDSVEMPYGTQVLWPDHCVQDSEGAAFRKGLETARANMIIRKGTTPEIDSYSAFFENDKKTATGLSGYLATLGIKRLFVCGIAVEFCVGFSALDGIREGFEAVLVADALGQFGGDDYAKMKKSLGDAGAQFAVVGGA